MIRSVDRARGVAVPSVMYTAGRDNARVSGVGGWSSAPSIGVDASN